MVGSLVGGKEQLGGGHLGVETAAILAGGGYGQRGSGRGGAMVVAWQFTSSAQHSTAQLST